MIGVVFAFLWRTTRWLLSLRIVRFNRRWVGVVFALLRLPRYPVRRCRGPCSPTGAATWGTWRRRRSWLFLVFISGVRHGCWLQSSQRHRFCSSAWDLHAEMSVQLRDDSIWSRVRGSESRLDSTATDEDVCGSLEFIRHLNASSLMI